MMTSMYRKVLLLFVGLIIFTMLGTYLNVTDGRTYVPTANEVKQSLKAVASDGVFRSAIKGYVSLNGEVAKGTYQFITDGIDVSDVNLLFEATSSLTGASSFESLVDKIVNLINIRI